MADPRLDDFDVHGSVDGRGGNETGMGCVEGDDVAERHVLSVLGKVDRL
ncbi:hypothetical protein [Salinispora arenicola]|nr:hypothetical protein [Salinispora arenicola]